MTSLLYHIAAVAIAITLATVTTSAQSVHTSTIPASAWVAVGQSTHDLSFAVGARYGLVAVTLGGTPNAAEAVPPDGTTYESSAVRPSYRGPIYGGDVCAAIDVPNAPVTALVGGGVYIERSTAKENIHGRLHGSMTRADVRADGVVAVQWRPVPQAVVGAGWSLVLGPSVAVGIAF